MDFKNYINDFKNKNYKNFEDFYNCTYKQVYFIVLGLTKDEMLSDDIMQETYTSFLVNIDKIDENRNILSYLITIAKNKCVDNYRKNNKTIVNNEIVDSVSEDKTNSRIKNILSLIDDNDEREIIIYHIIFDYKFREISKIMNKPLGTILWTYNRAIKILKERVDKLYEN